MFEVFWDVETKSWFDETGSNDPAKLGVSIVSVYWRNNVDEQLTSFWEKEFDAMWKLFRQADRIIGFNTKEFDVPVLTPLAPADFAKLPHFDILEQIKLANSGRGASLNAIAKTSLGQAKIDSGANAVLYWQKGDPQSLALLRKYCEADVLLTRDVYDFGMKNGHLKFIDRWNNSRQVQIDFSYPQSSATIKQSSLF